MKLISGNSNRPLAEAVADFLERSLAQVSIRRFADKEIFVEVQDNVRGEDVFVIQPTSYPANDNLMELLIIIDTLRRGSARRITTVMPYYGYARQDRKTGPRTPISAKLVANLICQAGANRVLTIDMHAGQIQGFFDIPTDNLFVSAIFARNIQQQFTKGAVTIVTPDIGGIGRARSVARRIGAGLVIVDKRRDHPGASSVMNIIGDVVGKDCILVDDIVDSSSTLCNAAQSLMEAGANSVNAYVTHGVFSGTAVGCIKESSIRELVITDSIEAREEVRNCSKIRIFSVASLLGEAIDRIAREESVSVLFE
ncbi:MAG: ribose-phosphate pyrophosphokinase [Pseudomonadota bacterium]